MSRFHGKRVSRQWKTVLTAAERDGIKFQLNSGRRTMGEQRTLYAQNMLNGRPRPGRPLTAVPNPNAPHIKRGRVDHALDVDSWMDGENKLQQWLRSKGLTVINNVPGEVWHFEATSESALKKLAARLKRKKPPVKAAENVVYALRARRAGARYALRIVREAKREGVQLSLAFALVEQETGFRNVFGHDPTIFAGAGEVTKAKYLAYRDQRGRTHMQGVGPCQLTWWATQDLADKEGGCWRPAINIRVGLRTLAQNIKAHGQHVGVARYNGSGPAAERYAVQVEQKQQKWHRTLVGGKA